MRTIADMRTKIDWPDDWPEAVYLEQEVAAYRNNPFIEALPPIADDAEATDNMQVDVRASEMDRAKPSHIRRHLVASIATFHQPFDAHIELFHTIGVMLRQGYIARNPLKQGFVREMQIRLAALEKAAVAGQPPITQQKGLGAAQSVSLLGLSGVGKTQAINGVFRAYKRKGVLHTQLAMGPMQMVKQLFFLKVTCPEGSVRTLCTACIHAMDTQLGTSYARSFCTKPTSAAILRVELARLAWLHGLGMLVIDEVQHLRFASGDTAEHMKNYFKILADVMMLPVIVIGTLDARKVLGGDFQSSRRHAGIPDMLPLPLYDQSSVYDGPAAVNHEQHGGEPKPPVHTLGINGYFRFICVGLFGAQFLREPIEPDDSLLIVLHDLSQGVLGVLVKLFMLAQYRALSIGVERLSEELFIEVYNDCFGLLHHHLNAMRSGKQLDGAMFGAALESFDEEFKTVQAVAEKPSAAGARSSELITSMPRPVLSVLQPNLLMPDRDLPEVRQDREVKLKRRSKAERSNCVLVQTVDNGLANGISPHEALVAAGFVRSIDLEVEAT